MKQGLLIEERCQELTISLRPSWRKERRQQRLRCGCGASGGGLLSQLRAEEGSAFLDGAAGLGGFEPAAFCLAPSSVRRASFFSRAGKRGEAAEVSPRKRKRLNPSAPPRARL